MLSAPLLTLSTGNYECPLNQCSTFETMCVVVFRSQTTFSFVFWSGYARLRAWDVSSSLLSKKIAAT